MRTRLTERFRLDLPVIQAPMAFVAGGALARAVSDCGGLGLIGGGYGDPEWIEAQFEEAGNTPVGCGFISFALEQNPGLFEQVLARKPVAMFLSFADPAPFLEPLRQAEVPIICQVQTLRDACHAIDLGVDVVVAQGGDAGGHGQSRGSMAFVPEVADEISRRGSSAILCAAGGIADGRGLVSALALGADGVVMGTRFWAANEALVDPRLRVPTLSRSGDDTIRTKVVDIIRGISWPERYTGRVLKTDFVERWGHNLEGLNDDLEDQKAQWQAGVDAADTSVVAPFVGEAIGLTRDHLPASEIMLRLQREAKEVLAELAVYG